jgi:hypothetical protein
MQNDYFLMKRAFALHWLPADAIATPLLLATPRMSKISLRMKPKFIQAQRPACHTFHHRRFPPPIPLQERITGKTVRPILRTSCIAGPKLAPQVHRIRFPQEAMFQIITKFGFS